MDVSPIAQLVHEEVESVRFGDVLSRYLATGDYDNFFFAVAFLRTSGFAYLGNSVESYLDGGGEIYGVAGVDNEVTSREALDHLKNISTKSTIYHTTSRLTFHPKVYLFENEDENAEIIVGSGNMTRDGMFRNVEYGISIHCDFANSDDLELYQKVRGFIDALLDESTPNVQIITEDMLDLLEEEGKIVSEEDARRQASSGGSSDTGSQSSEEVRKLFPTQSLPDLPSPVAITHGDVQVAGSGSDGDTLILQLSHFDASHQPGTPGTEEVLIPKDAIGFFPDLSDGPRKHPDVYLDAEVETPDGPVTPDPRVRFWYYDDKREWRLSVREVTMEQADFGGGSLLVVTKTGSDSSPTFTIKVVNEHDEGFDELFDLCTEVAGDKRWGILSEPV